MKKSAAFAVLLVFLFAFNALSESFPLDPPRFEEHAVTGDGSTVETREVTLYYVAPDGVSLTGAGRVFSGDENTTLVENVINELLTSPMNLRFRVGSPEITLTGLEEACGIVTLDLSADATMSLDAQERYTFLTSISDTLLGIDGIRGVNILIGGRATQTEGLEAGVFTLNSGNVSALFAQLGNESRRIYADTDASYMRDVCIYYPSKSGNYYLPSVKQISLTSSEEDNVRLILSELLESPSGDGCFEALPEDYRDAFKNLSCNININEAGERILFINCDSLPSGALSFEDDFRAAATLTLCSFIPGLDAVCFTGAKEDVLCRRCDFSGSIGSTVTILFGSHPASDTQSYALYPCEIAVGPVQSRSGLEILRLAANTKASGELFSIFSEGISGADILGIELNEHTAVVDLSGNFYVKCQSLTEEQERLLIFGMIDMLCRLDGIRAVRFSFDGVTVEQLSGDIFLGTALMPDYDLIYKEG